MMPNAKALMALGFAFVAGVSTTALMTTGRSRDPARPTAGSGSPGEPGSASRAWEDPTAVKPAAAAPAPVVTRDERRHAAANPDRRPSPPARPSDDALRVKRTLTALRQARPSADPDGLPEIGPPPARRRTLADASPVDRSVASHARLVGDVPVPRPVQRLAGNFQGHGATRPARGGDGLLRWLAE